MSDDLAMKGSLYPWHALVASPAKKNLWVVEAGIVM